MPSLNLRLTDEQHETLAGWAAAGDRSIQREIVHRLFSTVAPARGGVAQGGPGDTQNGSTVPEPSPATQADRGRAAPPGASALARPFRGMDVKPSQRSKR